MAQVGQDRWMRSMAAFSERDLITMVTLGLIEIAYRKRKSVLDVASSLAGVPEPWESTIDAQSGVEVLRLTMAGTLWRSATGRSVSASKGCSSPSRRSNSSSGGSPRH